MKAENVCSNCGAHAPELHAGQTSFVCPYCRQQSEVAHGVSLDRRPLQDPGRRVGVIIAGALFAIIVIVAFVGWRAYSAVAPSLGRVGSSEASKCTHFSGASTRATWSGCPSGATLEVSCNPAFGVQTGDPTFDQQLTCDCLRDGAKVWFFSAQAAPPLASRTDAERVGRTSCAKW